MFLIIPQQDAYAIKSFERGLAAQNSGQLSWEIAPVWLLFHSKNAFEIYSIINQQWFGFYRSKFLPEEGSHLQFWTRTKA